MKYVVIVTSRFLCLFWVVAPTLIKDKVVGLVTFSSTDRQCFNYYKNKDNYFKDPDSAYMESSLIWTKTDNLDELREHQNIIEIDKVINIKEYDSIVKVKVRARNSMGGYASEDIYCPLADNNLINTLDSLKYDTRYTLKKLIERDDLIRE